MALWHLLKLAIWFGVAFALTTVVVAVALVFIVGAVVIGFALPSRTVRGQLRSLAANVEAGVALLASHG